MKATSKVKSAPPICGVGGGAYSRSISAHEYSPQIYRKQKVKRDMSSQFLLASCCPDEIRLEDRQSSRLSGEVPNAVGKAKGKCILAQVKWSNPQKLSRKEKVLKIKGDTLTDGKARTALRILAARKLDKQREQEIGKQARIAREALAKEQELANARTVAHLHIKRMEAKQAKRKLVPMSAFTLENAFAGL